MMIPAALSPFKETCSYFMTFYLDRINQRLLISHLYVREGCLSQLKSKCLGFFCLRSWQAQTNVTTELNSVKIMEEMD